MTDERLKEILLKLYGVSIRRKELLKIIDESELNYIDSEKYIGGIWNGTGWTYSLGIKGINLIRDEIS